MNKKSTWKRWHIIPIVVVGILIAIFINSIYLRAEGVASSIPSTTLSNSTQLFSNNYWSNYFTPGSGPVGLPGIYGMIACVIVFVLVIILLIRLPKGADADEYE